MKMFSYNELYKLSKKDKSAFPRHKLAVLGDCATQHLAVALTGQAYAENIGLEVFDADYNQVLAQVIDTASELYSFEPDSVLIFMCAEKLYSAFCELPEDSRLTFAETKIAEIQNIWHYVSQNCKANILQFNFVENDDGVFGNYANKQKSSFIYQLRKLNFLLCEAAADSKNVFIVDLCRVQSTQGRNILFDPKLYYIAKMPLSTAVLPEVAKEVTAVIRAVCGNIKKCVVCDLDNTLWGGVIGDDGINGIQIGELGLGHAFADLQVWLKELKNRGIILAICSKNNEDTAKEPFEKHNEMVLKLEDISVFVANWEDKASNIRQIQQTLNIGMDSIVFIDDNPFERGAVKSLIPSICVPDLPEDPALYLSYLKSLNLFETASFSDEDKFRTSRYREAADSAAAAAEYANYDEYLQSLNMTAEAKPFDEYHYPRIAQLTQRSNQFNLRTIRYSEAEIASAANDPNRITLYFTLRDRFTDHGLISVVILEKQSSETLFISEWLMSCRVLKRGVEEFVADKIMNIARLHGAHTVIGEYIKTPKNAMVENIYAKLGFVSAGDGRFLAGVDTYAAHLTYIAESAVR